MYTNMYIYICDACTVHTNIQYIYIYEILRYMYMQILHISHDSPVSHLFLRQPFLAHLGAATSSWDLQWDSPPEHCSTSGWSACHGAPKNVRKAEASIDVKWFSLREMWKIPIYIYSYMDISRWGMVKYVIYIYIYYNINIMIYCGAMELRRDVLNKCVRTCASSFKVCSRNSCYTSCLYNLKMGQSNHHFVDVYYPLVI